MIKRFLAVIVLVLLVGFGSACAFTNTISQIIASDTPTFTSTATNTATTTSTSTPTVTLTATATATETPTATATQTETPRPTRTFTKAAPKPSNTTSSSEGGEGGGDSGGGCNGANSAMESSVFSMINSQRSGAGLGSLQSSSTLTSIARSYSKSMAENGFFSHGDIWSRINASGAYTAVGEILYAGPGSYNSASSAIASWLASSDHRAQMLSSTYTQMGVGYWCDPNSQYEGYFTVDFARP
ncbi:MAG: hypothetical protein FP831_06155 [Anaerolineae bacterium]|nr:hypothetical protein [Anaerolineae bacterium]